MRPEVRRSLQRGVAIPACPLALNSRRRLDERRQRALLRYYAAAGAGGIAVGVHTTQFAIRSPQHGLFRPLLALAAEEFQRADASRPGASSDTAPGVRPSSGAAAAACQSVPGGSNAPLNSKLAAPEDGRTPGAVSDGARRTGPLARIGGICGETRQAVEEAGLLRELGFDAGLLSLAALKEASEDRLLEHCRAVGQVLPLIGFYLQPAVGGRVLPLSFWRRFLELDAVIAIKIAPFNRYQTLDVVRATAESGRTDVALYTGNDDNIALDLLTPYRFQVDGRTVERRIVGGLLGHWSVWTRRAVELLEECHRLAQSGAALPPEMLRRAVEVTDANAAFFDAANGFAGCIAGLHEVLRRQGLLEGIWCLEPNEGLSPGQGREIERVCSQYPHLGDDAFVAAHRDEWLR